MSDNTRNWYGQPSQQRQHSLELQSFGLRQSGGSSRKGSLAAPSSPGGLQVPTQAATGLNDRRSSLWARPVSRVEGDGHGILPSLYGSSPTSSRRPSQVPQATYQSSKPRRSNSLKQGSGSSGGQAASATANVIAPWLDEPATARQGTPINTQPVFTIPDWDSMQPRGRPSSANGSQEQRRSQSTSSSKGCCGC